MAKIIHYYVEGECEKKLIDTLKHSNINLLMPGKVEVFNVVQNKFTTNRIATLPKNTHIVLVYDVDIENTEILRSNINFLNKYGFKNIHHLHSIENFENELIYSSSVKDINDVFNTNNTKEFKSRFINHRNLYDKLMDIDFDINKFWSRKLKTGLFSSFDTDSGTKLIKNNNIKK